MASVATSTPQSEGQSEGPLLRLPEELRRIIYKLVFPPGKTNLFSVRDHLKLARQPRRYPGPNKLWSFGRDYIALMTTCRAIHEEAKPILYENTEFVIHCSWDPVPERHMIYFVGSHQWDSWRYEDLPEIDVFLHLRHAWSISINVRISKNRDSERKDLWMHQLPSEISGVIKLRKLHISVESERGAHHRAIQVPAHKAMSLLERIRCDCPVTATMGVSLGAAGFRSASYYAMLSALNG